MAIEFKLASNRVSPSKLKALKGVAASKFGAPNPKRLVGYWINCDPKTRGVEALRIGGRRNLKVEAWGSCSPKWCVWGAAKPARAYSESVSSAEGIAFTAEWDFGFSEVIMTGHICEGCLSVETFTNFKDRSKRYDYYSRHCLYQVDAATWKIKTKGMI